MTDPDPVAALAAQLEQMRGQWARSQGEIGALRERLNGETGQTAMSHLKVKQLRELAKEVTELREKLDEVIAKRQATGFPAPYWLGLSREEQAARLAALRAWVGQVASQYPGYMARLPRCWENHREAVWELSTLRAEWDRIYGGEDNRDLKGALNWHDKWFPGVLSRLAASIRCDELGCRATGPLR